MNVFLVGPMGVGKTAIGRALARGLKQPFHDTDHEIQRLTGVDAGFIFEKEGEAGFRARERDAIESLTQLEDIVLATGGGAVLDARNRRLLAERGTVVYLRASIDEQLERTRVSKTRPLLEGPEPRATLERLAAVREPLYEEIADITIDTGGRRVSEVAHRILDRIRQP